ncbi:hypothetical protein AB7M31_003002 [Pseudomonas sp. IAP-CY TE4608]
MLAGALFTGDPGSVISLRQLSIRFDRPAEQVGEHHGGAGGCLASGDSGGIRAGATDGGSEMGGFTAQPLASSIGVSSASISNRSFFQGICSHLLAHVGAALFFLSSAPLSDYFRETLATVARRRRLARLGKLD